MGDVVSILLWKRCGSSFCVAFQAQACRWVTLRPEMAILEYLQVNTGKLLLKFEDRPRGTTLTALVIAVELRKVLHAAKILRQHQSGILLQIEHCLTREVYHLAGFP